jgi:hypothetical protein
MGCMLYSRSTCTMKDERNPVSNILKCKAKNQLPAGPFGTAVSKLTEAIRGRPDPFLDDNCPFMNLLCTLLREFDTSCGPQGLLDLCALVSFRCYKRN